jgi:hypothetical protein
MFTLASLVVPVLACFPTRQLSRILRRLNLSLILSLRTILRLAQSVTRWSH